MDSSAQERFWTRRAAGLARQVNLGWWLDRFNSLAVVPLLVFALVILAVRTSAGSFLTLPLVAGCLGGLLLLLALLAWFLSRARYIGMEAGLVRLDDRLHLHNRLSAAYDRVGPWPGKVEDRAAAGFRWRCGRALLPAVLALALVAAASYVPVRMTPAGEPVAPVEPGAWEQMGNWLATLEEENLVRRGHRSRNSGVASKNCGTSLRKNRFSHSSLEATDTLADSLGRQLRELATEMAALERNISTLKSFSTQMSESATGRKVERISGSA